MASILDRLKGAVNKDKFRRQSITEKYDFDNRYATLQEKFRNSSVEAGEDPTWMSFGLFPDFNSHDSGLLVGGKGSNVNIEKANIHYDNARWYLSSIGEQKRRAALDIFQTIFWHLMVNSPWYFESIEGLDKIFNFYPMEGQVMNGGKDNSISVTCWESVDLRVTTMLYNYYLATTDYENNRIILPRNLDSFTLTIYVNDYRTINNVIPNEFITVPIDLNGNYVKDINPDGQTSIQQTRNARNGAGYKLYREELVNDNGNLQIKQNLEPLPLDYFRNKVGFVVTLYGCTIDKSTIGENIGTVSNAEPEQLKKKITFNFKRAEYELVNEALLYQKVGAESEVNNLDKKFTEVYTERYNPIIARDKRNLRSKFENRLSLGLNRGLDSLNLLVNDSAQNLQQKALNSSKASFNAYAKQLLKKPFKPFESLKRSLGNIFEEGIVGQRGSSVSRLLGDSLRVPSFNSFR